MKDWTLQEATDADLEYLESGGNPTSSSRPLLQWLALQQIGFWESAYKAGDTFAVLHAVAECARHDLIMPEWVKREFLSRYQMVARHKVKLLDEAFGTLIPKGGHLSAYRKDLEIGPVAFREVLRRNAAGEAIDEGLFERIGDDLGVSGSTVRDFYHKRLRFGVFKKDSE